MQNWCTSPSARSQPPPSFLELKFDSSKAEEKHFMKLPRICLHFKPITLLSIPRNHCLLPNIPQRLAAAFFCSLLLAGRAVRRKTCRLASNEDKARCCSLEFGIWSFSDTKAKGPPGDKRLVSRDLCPRAIMSAHSVPIVSGFS